MPKRLLKMALILAAGVPGSLRATVLVVTPLSSIPSGASAEGMNNSDQISGVYNNAPFIATLSTFTPQSIPAGLNRVFSTYINDSGLLGGAGYLADLVTSEAFVGSTALANPLNYNGAFAYSLNDSGEMAGYYTSSSLPNAGGLFTTSGGTAETNALQLYGINNSGVATGDTTGPHVAYGSGPSFTTIPGSSGAGTGINSAGHICAQDGLSGYYFDGTTITPIPMPGGYTFYNMPVGQCINDSNQIVGVAHNAAGYAAFEWDPVNGTVILNTLVPANWDIFGVLAINNRGDILAQGFNGTYFGPVLLTAAPEPSTMLLASLALLGMFAGWRRSSSSAA